MNGSMDVHIHDERPIVHDVGSQAVIKPALAVRRQDPGEASIVLTSRQR